MKGLIRQQISRLPFKCQASIQLAARGRKAGRVEQNGTIYNQSQKSHSSALLGVTSSGCLQRFGTRETLNQLLFDDFLSTTSMSVLMQAPSAGPLQDATSAPCLSPFLPSRSRAPISAPGPRKHTIDSCQTHSKWTAGSALLLADS